MSKKPEDRFQTVQEVAVVFEQWLAHCQQPETVARPMMTAVGTRRTNATGRRSADDSPRSILGHAWHDWWCERDRWVAISVQTMLILVYVACMICFVSMSGSGGHDAEGKPKFSYRLGTPSPWFRFDVNQEPKLAFQTGINLWTNSVLIGLVGCAAYYVYWRIEKVRNPKMSKWNRPAYMLGCWGIGALFAVGLGHWQGYTALAKQRVVNQATEQLQGDGVIAASASHVDLNGDWDSRWQKVTFAHEKPKPGETSLRVEAVYYSGDGKIEGTLNLLTRTLQGRFHEKSGANGPIRLVVSPDGRTITGRYAYRQRRTDADPTVLTWDWDMMRIGEPPDAAGGKWQPLFNSHDLTGWKPRAEKPGDWKVENRVLVGRSPFGYLMHGGFAGKPFHLRAETRINDGGYGAIIVHPAGPRPDGALYGVWASINSTNEHYKTGHLIGIYPNYSHSGGELKQRPAPGEWFTLEVISHNGRVSLRVNGTTTHEIELGDRQDDEIALAVGNGTSVVEFRKIDVQWLPAK